MEVLGRRDGAPRVVLPTHTSDMGMTMSLKIPDSYRRKRAAPNEQSTRQETTKASEIVDSPTQEAGSWEDRDDWNEVTRRISTDKHAGHQVEKKEVTDTWVEDDLPDLPDDFPILIVNLTRLHGAHLAEGSGGNDRDGLPEDPDELMDMYETVKRTIRQHYLHIIDGLFEEKLCFHCSNGSCRSLLDSLHLAYPEDVFAVVDYPTEISDMQLHEYYYTLSEPTIWKSVNAVKDCIRKCSRDLKWKYDVISEVETLAQSEHDRYITEQERLSSEIDDLTRLRDSFQEKLSSTSKGKNMPLLERKLEDIENRLTQLLDTFLNEPTLEEDECKGIFQHDSMNLLDMVLAMVFSRLPPVLDPNFTEEEHFQSLVDYHIHILQLWKKDFGRLPQRSVAPVSQEDEAEEQVLPLDPEPSLPMPQVDPVAPDDWEQIACKETKDSQEGSKDVDEDGYAGDNDQETEKRTRSSRKKVKKSRVKKKKAPFQPYACTGALGALQASKDKEQLTSWF